MAADILAEIVANKRQEVAQAMARVPQSELEAAVALLAPREPRSMKEALAKSATGIISEFKRKSPSKGWIHKDARPEDVVPGYAAAGASAISILTDEKYFGGCLDYIVRMRPLVDVPILRKDFIISDYQIYEARLAGADAILLIAACLSREEFFHLMGTAHSLGLEVLLEVHSEQELDYVTEDVDMLGVNNRNLGSFVTDVRNSFRLASLMEQRVASFGGNKPVLVSESGLSSTVTVRMLRHYGFRGFLMGENFMKEENPSLALKSFVDGLHAPVIKVCGMTQGPNIAQIEAAGPDMMGFIFYEKSPRRVQQMPSYLPQKAQTVGVFVNWSGSQILQTASQWHFNWLQLHGKESPQLCAELRAAGYKIIKAFSMESAESLEAVRDYASVCDLFLFDTATPAVGGSGRGFDWSILSAYDGPVPFLLSGGIGPDSAQALSSFSHRWLLGYDVNSRFESSPGVKDPAKTSEFINKITSRI